MKVFYEQNMMSHKHENVLSVVLGYLMYLLKVLNLIKCQNIKIKQV